MQSSVLLAYWCLICTVYLQNTFVTSVRYGTATKFKLLSLTVCNRYYNLQSSHLLLKIIPT